MSALVESVLEILLEGAIGAAGSKRVPLWARALLWAVLLALFAVFFALLIWAGLRTGRPEVLVCAAALLAFCLIGAAAWCRRWRGRRERQRKGE